MLNQAHLTFASINEKQGFINCLSLPQNIFTNQHASNSVLLSLAAHVTYKLPFMNVFAHFSKECPEIKPQQNEFNSYLTYHPLFEPWCELFSEAVLKNHVIRKDNTLFIVLFLTNEQMNLAMGFKQKLVQFRIQREQNQVQKLLKKVSGYQENKQLPRKKTKITYLNVSGSQLRTDPYIPIPNVRAIVLGQFYNNENWSNFNILKGDIPSLENFLQVDSVIITGSTNSVLSQIPEIKKMSDNLFQAFDINKKLKIFGICYGHQLIAQRYNGQVVRKQRTDKIQIISFDEKILGQLKEKYTFLKKITNNQDGTLLLQHHEDYVEQVSEQFHILASSPSSKVQCLLHKSGRMLSFQGHPEFFMEFSQSFINRLSKYQNNKIDLGLGYKDQKQRSVHIESTLRMREVVADFLAFQASEEEK